jgi:hypothetical protein
MYFFSGGSRFRAPTSAASRGATTPSSRSIRKGIPQRFPEATTPLCQIAVGVDPHDREPIHSSGDTCRGADVSAAASS